VYFVQYPRNRRVGIASRLAVDDSYVLLLTLE
jgi:hypothetical protein